MGKVTTGCRDCKNCTNSAFAHTGRELGRASAALFTVGISEIALATRKKCRVCGHQMSLHAGAVATTPQPAVQVQYPPPVVASPPRPLSIPERLQQLDGLLAQGLITPDEHTARRAQILAEI